MKRVPGPRSRVNFLAQVRRICLALPEAHEKIAWGAPTFRVRNKQFAMFLDNHHGDGRIAVWCDPTTEGRPPAVGNAGTPALTRLSAVLHKN